jgi:hypothetical protein
MTSDNEEDILRIIGQIINRVMADGGLPPGSRFNGYAIIAGPGGMPAMIRIQSGETWGLSPEVVDGDGEIHITAALPPGCDLSPSLTFQPLMVGISLGDETTRVDLPSRVDVQACSWQVRNGVLDISCRKV